MRLQKQPVYSYLYYIVFALHWYFDYDTMVISICLIQQDSLPKDTIKEGNRQNENQCAPGRRNRGR